MNRTHLALAATLALALVWLGPIASAATTTTTVTLSGSAYTDLGAGPMLLSSNNGDMTYRVSDSQPSPGTSGHIVRQGVSRDFIQTTAHVWAIGPRDGVIAVVSIGTGISTGSAAGGSTGTDYSANKPTLPNVGANFAASGPYASYILIATVPANASRLSIDVENNSGSQIAVVIDDGTAANGAAPVNASVFAIAGGSGVGSQGGSWVSTAERGRVQIYALSSSAQVAVRAN